MAVERRWIGRLLTVLGDVPGWVAFLRTFPKSESAKVEFKQLKDSASSVAKAVDAAAKNKVAPRIRSFRLWLESKGVRP